MSTGGDESFPAIPASGRTVAFVSASNLALDDFDQTPSVYASDLEGTGPHPGSALTL